MSLLLYMDHHVPSAITEGLRQRGVDVVTAGEDGASEFDDRTLLNRAPALGRVLFSQDEDLLAIADERMRLQHEFSGLIYAHQLAISIGQAVRDLEVIAKALEPHEMQNRVEYIPY